MVSFNVGYHNEHHDLVTIPWSRLPQVRRIAPEFYEGLHAYTSWTGLLARFLRDPNITLFNTIIRPPRENAASDRGYAVLSASAVGGPPRTSRATDEAIHTVPGDRFR